MKCPNCGLINPDIAQRCDCGHKFRLTPGELAAKKRAENVAQIAAKKGHKPVANKMTRPTMKEYFKADPQRAVLFVTAAVLLLMLLFPPFHFEYGTRATFNMGYSFIFSPPMLGTKASTINVATLLAQCAVVLAAGALCWFALRKEKK